MYSKQETAQLIQSFWTSFGQYMSPVPSAEGLKINWINYKTAVKDLHFKMYATERFASISIELNSTSLETQTIAYQQLLQLKKLLRDALQEDWRWERHIPDENNKIVSRIYTSREGVNIYKKEDWPAIISFLKPRIIALDAFWADVKYGFTV
ncbi:MAG: DUF4268 domain-containing protein [Chitinophagaceae bacterium]